MTPVLRITTTTVRMLMEMTAVCVSVVDVHCAAQSTLFVALAVELRRAQSIY